MKPVKNEIPKIEYPNWLPTPVKEAAQRRLEIYAMSFAEQDALAKKARQEPELNEFHEINIAPLLRAKNRYSSTLKPAFTSENAKDFWIDLCNQSPEKSQNFVDHLFHVENDFDGAKRIMDKHKNEVAWGKDILKRAGELRFLMLNYQNLFFGHFLNDDFFNLLQNIERFESSFEKKIVSFRDEYKKTDSYAYQSWPVTRELNSKNALPLFFIRKNYFFFNEHFGKPLHRKNADIVNAIFENRLSKPYEYNDVVKAVGQIKNLKK